MMNDRTEYRYRKHLLGASLLALAGPFLGLVYAWYATPWTMMAFLGGGSLLILVAIGIFAYTQVRDFKAHLESMVPKHFAKGEVICRQGDQADRIYFIRQGEVEVIQHDPVKGEVRLGTLGPGYHFGETGIFRHGSRQATVRALSDLETMSVHTSDFQTLYRYLPRLQERLNKEYQRRRQFVEQAIRRAKPQSDSDRPS